MVKVKLTEGDLTMVVKRIINEIYSDKDMIRGEELGNTYLGMDIKFRDDYRLDKLIIKKLVRLKSRVDDNQLKNEIDSIIDLLEKSL